MRGGNDMLKTFCTVLTAVLLCGCASTRSTITEFDKDGKITRVTESTQSVIQTLMSSTQNKSVIIWEDGWAAYISGSTGTIDDPTPHGKIFCGKVNKGWISLQKDQQNIAGIAKIIRSTKSDVSVTLEGVNTTSSDLSGNKKQ